MQHEPATLNSMLFVGKEIRTSNDTPHEMADMWTSILTENIPDKIPNRVDHRLITVYSSYEKDHTKPFNYFVGAQVSHVDHLPDGLISLSIPPQNYLQHKLDDGVFPDKLIQAWHYIWQANYNRSFSFDLEIYDFSKDLNNPYIDLYIAVEA